MREPVLRSISPSATPEEVAAITAAIEAVVEEQQRTMAVSDETEGGRLSMWVAAHRLGARRVRKKQGPWRLSGRIIRRVRA